MTVSFIILTALALSMDAFAVSVSCGITNSTQNTSDKFKLAFAFGFFQGGMPLISFYLTNLLLPGSSRYAGYISFIIMVAIGIHMIIEFSKKEEECGYGKITLKRILFLSVATSLDAFVAGLTFALVDGNIFIAAGVIAGITLMLSLAGVFFGCKIGGRLKKSAELIGAIMLILIGIKFLVDSIL